MQYLDILDGTMVTTIMFTTAMMMEEVARTNAFLLPVLNTKMPLKLHLPSPCPRIIRP